MTHSSRSYLCYVGIFYLTCHLTPLEIQQLKMAIMKFKWVACGIIFYFTGLLVFKSFVYNAYNLNFCILIIVHIYLNIKIDSYILKQNDHDISWPFLIINVFMMIKSLTYKKVLLKAKLF
ncbi:hypothetical protein AL468_19685 [Vibrio diabolicus]|uniref:Uncharacterized protein n=1 Tax=Vibrio diabolicus TaxID=50719 RepID=A0ABM6SG64_9VIBR|nr:hypothetical protein AL468_19685 [Vibrio diabolicus]